MANYNPKNSDDENKTKIIELANQKKTLTEITDALKNRKKTIEEQKKEIEQKLFEKDHTTAELEQQKIILNTVSNSLENQAQELEKSRQKIEKRIEETTHKSAESEQSKVLLAEMMSYEKRKKHTMQKKQYIVIILAAIISSVIISGFFYYESTKSIETEKILEEAIKTKEPLIQNLKGDVVDTWISWRKNPGDTLYVNIINARDFPEEKIKAIKDAALSLKTVAVGDSVLYEGWKGAFKEASKKSTRFYIPAKIEFIEGKGKGDITIELSKNKDPAGYSGFTNPIVNVNQILLSKITLYDVNSLTDDRLMALTRHEFGHAIGLAHSTAKEDLMAPIIKTENPYISECVIDAIQALYDGNQKAKVECQK